jgi:hypothetical protein
MDVGENDYGQCEPFALGTFNIGVPCCAPNGTPAHLPTSTPTTNGPRITEGPFIPRDDPIGPLYGATTLGDAPNPRAACRNSARSPGSASAWGVSTRF